MAKSPISDLPVWYRETAQRKFSLFPNEALINREDCKNCQTPAGWGLAQRQQTRVWLGKHTAYQLVAPLQKPPPWGGRGLAVFAKCPDPRCSELP